VEPETALQTYRQLWQRLARIPGVTAAGGVTALPLSQMFAWGPITVEGRPLATSGGFINVDQRVVAADYFRAMEIPLLSGRLFNEQDTLDKPRVVIVDDHMARELWPNEDPVGKRIRVGGMDAKADLPWMTVIGVVGGVKQYTLDSDSRMAMHLAHTQYRSRGLNVVVRSHVDAASLTSAIRKEIHELDPDLPLYNVRTMEDRVDESLARRRFSMLLLSLFACLALGLATIGIYGVISYLVSQGTREVGIRIALGATPGGILFLIVRQGLFITTLGVAIGVASALLLTPFMRSLLFGVEATDPATFGLIAGLLTLVALVATYVPARRATRIDPVVAMRSE
jgi:predicted permease